MFNQMKDMYKLQKQAKQIKKELAKVHVFAESDGVKVTVNGEQLVISVEINEEASTDKTKLAKAIMECTNRAMKKAQQVAAERMKSMMGGMPGLSGLMGG